MTKTKWKIETPLIFSRSLIALLVMLFIAGCEYEQYHNQLYELTGSIDDLLVTEKLCIARNNCSGKEYVLGSGQTGVNVTVYGITDKKIIKKIVDLVIDAHSKYPQIRYHLRMVTQTSEESHKSVFKSDTTIVALTLEKEA